MRVDFCILFLPTVSSFFNPAQQKYSWQLNSEIPRGDARGAAVLIDEIWVSRGSQPILSDISWRVEPTQKWAIVGANGAGKSTLLKAIMGDLLLDEGSVVVSQNLETGYLQQTAVSGSTKTIYDEAASAMKDIMDAKKALDDAQILVEEGDENALDRLDRAVARFEAVGGYTQEQQVSSVLKGLGFTDLEKRCNELSGGWQMRVALARLLLSKPQLLLLDEPSNHLDVNARQWLANYLGNYDAGAMILVTHDVTLLEKAVDNICEVNAGSLQKYKSVNYQQYLKQKDERAAAAQTEYERNLAKAKKLQDFVDKWGASATKAPAAQSRVKMIEKMRQQGLLDAPSEAVSKGRFKPSLRLPDPPHANGDVLCELSDADVGYDNTVLVKDVNLKIERGMKLLLRGPNGVGKSTILQTLRGTLPLINGNRIDNDWLRLGVFTQDLAQELSETSKAVDLVTQYARQDDTLISDEQARSAMGQLGLKGESSLRKIKELSGGEKARVALAMFAMKPSNLLLLDEPSNHLDVECIEALGEGLSDWEGAVVVISHDQNFCQQIPFTHVGTVENGQFTLEQRTTRPSDWTLFDEVSNSAETKQTKKPEIDRTKQKRAYNAPKRIAKIEKEIEDSEERMEEIDAEMLANGSDVALLTELTQKRNVEEAKVADLMQEWEELEELLACA